MRTAAPVAAPVVPPPAAPPTIPARAPAAPTVSRRPVAQATAAADFDEVMGVGTSDVPIVARRFDPTALVLIIVVVAVIVGVIIAVRTLFSGFDTGLPVHRGTRVRRRAPRRRPPRPPPRRRPRPLPRQPAGPPVIASATTIDPSDTDGEHEEDAAKAFDGNPATFWYTQTYKRADFAGFKPAVGYAITLTTKTTVNTVTLHSNSTGGHVEIRATDAAHPTDGPVLASGSFGPETAFTLVPPPDTQSLVLWITELPTTADGSFRLELTEISLS